ncbi:V-type proton ATPase subunit E [Methanobacterium petrolearium]|uniref:V-type proton ATPase subunit E n=1 Tax=Methanobacterium petrolearium TaxID=710190 RepID=UPI001AE4B4BC|nr:V-type proton ATPase subunit E [Methanobacterium petrolearium]MBP1945911.1 V/A-type H+-transporting ATPase subunit E [Methanobacterium petrolearium]BDZ69534.1 ATP synthase subunit E [Methanobacterium petrolearium]
MSAGTEKIVSSIMSDAQIKADSILTEAEKENETILSEGKSVADTEKEKILENADKQAKMRYQQIISEAKMNSRRMELEAREEVIEEAFQKAEEKLKELASSDASQYKESLEKVIVESGVEIGGGDLVILVKESDTTKITSSISSLEKSISDKTGNTTKLEMGENITTIGGAIVKTKNGEIEVNNTIEARMLRFKKSLRSEVAGILFK